MQQEDNKPFNLEDDDLYSPPGTLKEGSHRGKKFFWFTGLGEQHAFFGDLTTEVETRHEGWCKFVYHLRARPDGTPWYEGRVSYSDFYNKMDPVMIRQLGQLFSGIILSDEEEAEMEAAGKADDEPKSGFERLVSAELGNSKKVEEGSAG